MDERNPSPEEGFTAFKNYEWVGDKTIWLDYATERVGRFVGLVNADGSTKTECGIHVAGAEKTFDRDLWDADSKVSTLASAEEVTALKASGKEVRDFVQAEMNTKSFPTINYIGADGTPTKYESEVRTVAALTDFAKSGGKVT